MAGVSEQGGDPACWADQFLVRPRHLEATEIGELLNADLVAHLATVDAAGWPHTTPIWFLWDGDAFLLSARPHRPHVRRLRRDPRATICVDDEAPERPDGERPNRQVRASGAVEIFDDVDGAVARSITAKYLHGPAAAAQADRRAAEARVVLRLVPDELVAVASL